MSKRLRKKKRSSSPYPIERLIVYSYSDTIEVYLVNTIPEALEPYRPHGTLFVSEIVGLGKRKLKSAERWFKENPGFREGKLGIMSREATEKDIQAVAQWRTRKQLHHSRERFIEFCQKRTLGTS